MTSNNFLKFYDAMILASSIRTDIENVYKRIAYNNIKKVGDITNRRAGWSVKHTQPTDQTPKEGSLLGHLWILVEKACRRSHTRGRFLVEFFSDQSSILNFPSSMNANEDGGDPFSCRKIALASRHVRGPPFSYWQLFLVLVIGYMENNFTANSTDTGLDTGVLLISIKC